MFLGTFYCLVRDLLTRQNVQILSKRPFCGLWKSRKYISEEDHSVKEYCKLIIFFTVAPLDDDEVDDEMDDFKEINHVNLGNIVGHAHTVSMAPSAPSSSSRIHSA